MTCIWILSDIEISDNDSDSLKALLTYLRDRRAFQIRKEAAVILCNSIENLPPSEKLFVAQGLAKVGIVTSQGK